MYIEIPERIKKIIDNMNYEDMLSIWIGAPYSGHPLCQGEVGAYFIQAMEEKRKKISDTEYVQIFKKLENKNA